MRKRGGTGKASESDSQAQGFKDGAAGKEKASGQNVERTGVRDTGGALGTGVVKDVQRPAVRGMGSGKPGVMGRTVSESVEEPGEATARWNGWER